MGKNKVIFKVANEGSLSEEDIEVIESDIRSIQQISGAWTASITGAKSKENIGIRDIKKMTDDQWRVDPFHE